MTHEEKIVKINKFSLQESESVKLFINYKFDVLKL